MSRRRKPALVDPWDPPFERRGRKAARTESLTDELVRALKPAEKEYAVHDWDQPGLFVRVRRTGSRTYYYRPRTRGNRRAVRIGSASKLSVAAARSKALEIDELLFQGHALRGFEPRRYSKTLRHAFDQYIPQEPHGGWGKRVWREFHQLILPVLGDVKLECVTYRQIDEIISTRPSYYSRRNLRLIISAFLSWCVTKGLLDTNVIRGRPASPAPPPRKRFKFSGPQLGVIWNACETLPPLWRDAFRLVIATGRPLNQVLSLRAGAQDTLGDEQEFFGPVGTELLAGLSAGRSGYLFIAPGKTTPMRFQQRMLEALRIAADMGEFTIGDLQRSSVSVATAGPRQGIQWNDLFPPPEPVAQTHDEVII